MIWTIHYRRRQQRQRQLAVVKYPAKAPTYATALTKGSPNKVTQSKKATYIDTLYNSKDVTMPSSEEPNMQSGSAQVATTKDQQAQAVSVTSSQLKEALQSTVQPQENTSEEERQHQLLEEQTLDQPPICLQPQENTSEEARQHQLLEEQTLDQPPIGLPEQLEAPLQKNRDNVKSHKVPLSPKQIKMKTKPRRIDLGHPLQRKEKD